MKMSQKHLVLASGGIAAGLLLGWFMWKRPATPAGLPMAQASDRVSSLVNSLPRGIAPAGQAARPTADPAFWGAWFRGHVGDEALRRAQTLVSAYGHHRAGLMIIEAIGNSMYGQNAKW